MNIKILVAAHKPCEMPQDDVYLPVQVGKALHPDLDLGYQPDNEGENISDKNPYYSELTAIYWAWKNCNADYIGLVHYRRYLGLKQHKKDKWQNILTEKEAVKLCSKHTIILPQKRKYYIESLWSHYKHTHDIRHLEKTRTIIQQDYPEYLPFFNKVMKRTWGHMFNMFIMKKELVNAYCSWLFDILFKLEKQIDFSQMSAFDARLFGRISELLLDVWIEKHRYTYKEVKMIQIGNENWSQKIMYFLAAKFFGKKYTQSR